MAYEQLKAAIKALADVCDGANEKDGYGFNGTDANFGHFLAGTDTWKHEWAVKARKMIHKYHNQLGRYGIDESVIPAVKDDTPRDKPRFTLTLADLECLELSEPVLIRKLNKWVSNYDHPLPDGFWDLWKAQKDVLKAAGWSVSQYQGYWQLAKWYSENPNAPAAPEPVIEVIPAAPISTDFSVIDSSLLFPYQLENAKACVQSVRKNGRFLNTSKVGAGKTFITLVACQQLGLKPFIVCPVPVRPGWIRSIKQLGMESYGVVNYETLRLGKYYVTETNKKGIEKEKRVECPYFSVVNNENKGKFESKKIMTWNLPADAIVIFDEAHYCKNRGTLNTQLMISIPEGVKCIALSATIAEGSLKMVGVGKILGCYKEPWEFYRFAQQYGARKECVARGVEAWVDRSSPKDLVRLKTDLGDKLHGIDTNDLRSKGLFPQTKIIADTFDFGDATKNIAAAYEALFEKMQDLRKTREYYRLLAEDTHLQCAQKEMQEVELAKIPTIVQMAQDFEEEGYSVAIFVNYTETLTQLSAALETDCLIYGGLNAERKEANRLAFEKNTQHFIICNSAAAGIGIDLHDKYHERPRISLISPNYSAQVLQQVLGRIDRAGGTATTQYILFAAGTIEEEAADAARKKIAKMEGLNQGINDFHLF
jgi:superfamily II DNA or RNA helicase